MQDISLGRALFYITLSIVLIWGTLFVFVWYQKKVPFLRKNDPEYTVQIIVEDLVQEDRLPITCLSEILSLSQDKPINIYSLDKKACEEKLHNHPVIATASVDTIVPNILHIQYRLKEPLASIADYENMVIDKNGALFPLRPFFSEKNLPKIYTGSTLNGYNGTIEPEKLLFSFELLNFVKKFSLKVLQIDIRTLFQEGPHRGEIVLIGEHNTTTMLFRLHAKNYKENLEKFFFLFPKIGEKKTKKALVDLRFKKMFLFKPSFG